nr:uncharacterized protein C10orf67 homolog, mitochondrial [Anolis sagrei ordinatus]
MAKAALGPVSVVLTREQDSMGATELARSLLSARRLSVSPNILELLSMPCLEELEADYRPRISDNLKIGFTISDHATQTDISEIGDLKEFMVTTRTLLQFANSISDDFARYKSVLQAQYEEKIKEHAFSLWLEINDKLKYIEDIYKQKEVKMRHSFQQQLCDALAILRAHYSKYFRIEQEIYGADEDSIGKKMERLRNELDEQAITILTLEEELQEYKRREKFSDRDIEIQLLRQEIAEFKEQMAIVSARNARLQDTVRRREKELVELENEMQSVQEKKEKDMKIIQKLVNSQELLKLELDREKQRVLSKTREVKEAQDSLARLSGAQVKVSPEVPSEVPEEKPARKRRGTKGKAIKEGAAKDTAARVAAAKKAAMKEAMTKEAKAKEAKAKEAKAKEAMAREARAKEAMPTEAMPTEAIVKETMAKAAMAKAAEAKELLLEPDKAAQEMDRATERKELQAEIKRLRKAEQEARQIAQRLQQDMSQSGRSWKMKFEILKKSLHAIKDEMFLRQSLRQAAKFRRTSFTERTPSPIHIQTSSIKKKSFLSGLYMQYSPLPDIARQPVTETIDEESNDVNKIPVTIEIPTAFGVSQRRDSSQGRDLLKQPKKDRFNWEGIKREIVIENDLGSFPSEAGSALGPHKPGPCCYFLPNRQECFGHVLEMSVRQTWRESPSCFEPKGKCSLRPSGPFSSQVSQKGAFGWGGKGALPRKAPGLESNTVAAWRERAAQQVASEQVRRKESGMEE